MSSAAGATGNAVPGWASMRGSSTSITGSSHPSSRPANPAVVTATTGAASASMNSIRASGSIGSIGRYAAPDFNTARIAMIASAERFNSNATHSPGPAPWPTSRCANRFEASSSSRYVHDRPPHTTATASGTRATCSANTTGIDNRAAAGSGQHRPVAQLIEAGMLGGVEHIDRRQPAAPDHRSSPPTPAPTARSAPRYWPRRTHRYGTPPTRKSRPAHQPRSQRSPNENTKSIRALWVSAANGLTCTSPNADSAAEPSACPAKFCQANITCTNG